MKIEGYTLSLIVGILSSAGFGMAFTIWFSRKKIRAETLLADAQAKFAGIETYSTMLNDLRTQINMQGDQLKNQAAQILNLQKKENQYINIIKNIQLREKEYLIQIRNLEKALRESEELLKKYQLKLQNQQHDRN